jgi:hypothetical protein
MARISVAVVASCLVIFGQGCGSTTTSEPDADPPDANPPDADPPDVMPMCGNGMIEFGEDCDDSGESATCDADCTAASCGDGTTNATASETCDDAGESATCDDDCTAAECGDGTINGTALETCDDSGLSETCDDDCTAAECGDGTVNDLAGETCDLGLDNSDYGRCGAACNWGPGMSGTWGTVWETRAGHTGNAHGLQTFHYSGATLIHETNSGKTYNPTTNVWGTMALMPSGSRLWSNSAVASDALYSPRDGNMQKYTFATSTWTIPHVGIPNGATQLTAAVFDGEGNIWFKGPSNADLVRYDPVTGAAMTFPHVAVPLVDMFETRMDYDPVTNTIVYAGYNATRFVKYDIDTGVFTQSSVNPGGNIKDNTCGDRSGHVYTGSTSYTQVYQYTIAADTWLALPNPPVPHDNVSTCAVSQDGWLYEATGTSWFRISLGVL